MAKLICVALFDKITQGILRDRCIEAGYDLTLTYGGRIQDENDFQFHITILVTNEDIEFESNYILEKSLIMDPIEFGNIGENNEYPCIHFETNGKMDKLRELFLNEGYTFSFDDFKPHTTLSYDKETFKDGKFLEFPIDFYFEIDRIEFRKLE